MPLCYFMLGRNLLGKDWAGLPALYGPPLTLIVERGGGREVGRRKGEEGGRKRRRNRGVITIGCGSGFKLDVLRLSVNVHVHK